MLRRCFSSSSFLAARRSPAWSSVRGMPDLPPDDCNLHEHIRSVFRSVSGVHGFGDIETPIVEHTGLFTNSLGDASDLVGKEMYTFDDRGGDSLSLRPEGTAGVVRAIVQAGDDRRLPVRRRYMGPFFRYERPQRGRARQFRQAGVESFTAKSLPTEDAELISLAHQFLAGLGLAECTKLHINTLGSAECRRSYANKLNSFFEARQAELSESSQQKLANGRALRILDSSHEADIAVVRSAPSILDSLNVRARRRFDAVLAALDTLNVPFEVNERLVRGLDYYTHTIFEYVAEGDRALGRQQGTALAGGRYDGIVGALGGQPHVASFGWAAGIERLQLLLLQQHATDADVMPQDSYLVACIAVRSREELARLDEPTEDEPTDEERAFEASPASLTALAIAQHVRSTGLGVMVEHHGTLKRQLNRANKAGVRLAVIVGEDELAKGVVRVRNMKENTEAEVPFEGAEHFEALDETLFDALNTHSSEESEAFVRQLLGEQEEK